MLGFRRQLEPADLRRILVEPREMVVERLLWRRRRSPGRRRWRGRADRRPSAPRIAPAIISIMPSATSSWTNSTRSAEQRWPALWNAERHDVARHLLGQRRAVDDHRILPAGLGDERDDRPVALGQRAVDRARGLGRAGEDDARRAADARSAFRRRPCRRRARAGRRPWGCPPACISSIAERADQRRLPGRLGDDGIARGQRRRRPGR